MADEELPDGQNREGREARGRKPEPVPYAARGVRRRPGMGFYTSIKRARATGHASEPCGGAVLIGVLTAYNIYGISRPFLPGFDRSMALKIAVRYLLAAFSPRFAVSVLGG